MRTNVIIGVLGFALAVGANAQPATGTGQSQGQSQGQGQGNTSLPPGLERRDELPPGLSGRDELPPGLAKRTNDLSATGRAGSTNQNQFEFGSTNQMSSTNEFSASSTNQFNQELSPTGSGASGAGGATGSGSAAGAGSASTGISASGQTTVTQDQAVTQTDRRLLTEIRQTVQTQITSLTTGGAVLPVHFVVRNGVVELVGTVPSAHERQRIETVVQQVPGVTRVVNRLEVRQTTGAGVGAGGTFGSQTEVGGASSTTNTNTFSFGTQGSATENDAMSPTSGTNNQSRIYSSTNQFGAGSTNELSPTGTNGSSRRSGLPPGLEKRDELPPGLQNRDELPPGLERRTNGAASD